MGCLDSPIFHNCTVYYTLNGPVEFSRLEYAFIQAATRHESLRTTYSLDPSSGEPKRGILKAPRLIWSQRDDTNETETVAEFSRMKKHVFDLENGHTMAVTLLSCGQNEHVLLLGHHHLIMDGISLTNLLREVAHIYGSGASLSPTVSQYANFSDRQRKYVLSEGANKDREYYKREFADITAPLPLLPVAKSAFRRICTDYEICTVQRRLNASLHSRIRQASSSVMSTPFQFHLSVLQLLLHRTLNVEDICIAIGNANRVDEEFDGTTGLILDVVPIRFYPNPSQTFTQLVHKTRKKVIAALSHGRTPYHTVLSGPDEAKKSTLSPLFQVVMNYISGATNAVRFGDAFLEYRDSEEAKHAQDLVVTIREDPDGTTLVTIAGHEYLYGIQEIEAILDIYFNLIQEVSEDAAMSLPLYNLFPESAKSHSLILGQGEAAPASWPETLSKRVSELSRGSPEQLALKDQKGSALPYREMQNRILAIADILWHSGAREGHFIAVLCGPTTDTVCSILAIWRIGAVYVPLDPSHGTGRLNSITSDCQPEILICSDNSHLVVAKDLGVAQTLDLTLPSRITNYQIPDRSRGSATAALIYTSGSTGAPKGVLLSHNNLVAQISAVQKRLNVGREIVLQQSSMGFDASLYQIFMALANGGTLVMAASRSEGRELTRVIFEEKITMTVAVPTEYQYWITSGLKNLRRCTDWHIAISAGERLTPALTAAFRGVGLPNLCLFNAYGPTEGSISCAMGKISLHEGSRTESIVDVIGTTLPGYQLYILDENLQPLQIGWPGEIFIGGAGVSLGYLNRESETRLNFIVNPLVFGKDFLKNRLYRTGDRGKILPDGRLRFMGRISCDTQVKLRGVRIELEEIAAVIVRASAGAITEAVVIQKDDSDPYLVAFVVFSHRRPVEMDPNYLHKLIRSLPLASSMLPAMAVSIDSIPININGKRDTAKLKAIPLHQPSQLTEDTDLSFIEKKIAELWREVLPSVSSTFSISRGTDFFSLGGNSILLLRIQTKIREMSGVQVSLPKLFQCSTLGEMAILMGMEASTSLDDQIIDWHLETSLSGSTLPLHENPDSPKWPPKVILMTGSTGFLGRAILSLLVDNPQIHAVHCLAVRTPSRLAHSPKLVIHSGDLSHTEFGLDGTTLATLSLTVDAIIHNGANVSFLKPYKALRASNVLATKLLAKLAAPRKIPIHYVSSAGVTRLAQQPAFPEASVSSYTPPSNVLTDGYLASKWASEVLLENAHTAWNIPITIHRPSSIIGPGAPERDIFANIIAISKRLRAAPMLDHWTGVFDLISVDRVSREIVSSVVDEKKGEKCTGLSFRNWCGERRFEASGLKGYIERELQADHTGRIIEIGQIAFVKWINDAREEGLDPLVVAYLERMSELDGGHLLPILDSLLVS
jgi:amino acid adenylation domain-containing protein